MFAESLFAPPTWLNRLAANPGFQKWASQIPLFRGLVRREGEVIFGILQGFVASQVLTTLVELRILHQLMEGPATPAKLGLGAGLSPENMEKLLRAGAALGLLRQARGGRYGLTRMGAAITGAPGLEAMILHNRALYADMADPIALLRNDGETQLAQFWPYVFSGDHATGDVAERYSDLMAQSQIMVAQDTLRMVSFRGTRRLLDVGGGFGVFLQEVLSAHPKIEGHLFDLPGVVATAAERLAVSPVADRVTVTGGNFQQDAFPSGADTISLIRVLYDHQDATVANLLAKAYETLPPGGRLIISEPMGGAKRPDPACDVYFAFYTLAMGTGTLRTSQRIAELCQAAGFADMRIPKAPRPFISSAVVCHKPG
ncbi:MAG: methyltransferase [Pseudomonadota bacterium]